MKKLRICFFILFFFLLNFTAFAESVQKVPEGMEAIQLGGSAELIVPKGAKTRKVGAQIIVEGTKEYMSRRFSEMEARLAAMEKRQDDLIKEVKSLKKILEEQGRAGANAAAER